MSKGTVAETVVPLPGAVLISSAPSTSNMRSRMVASPPPDGRAARLRQIEADSVIVNLERGHGLLDEQREPQVRAAKHGGWRSGRLPRRLGTAPPPRRRAAAPAPRRNRRRRRCRSRATRRVRACAARPRTRVESSIAGCTACESKRTSSRIASADSRAAYSRSAKAGSVASRAAADNWSNSAATCCAVESCSCFANAARSRSPTAMTSEARACICARSDASPSRRMLNIDPIRRTLVVGHARAIHSRAEVALPDAGGGDFQITNRTERDEHEPEMDREHRGQDHDDDPVHRPARHQPRAEQSRDDQRVRAEDLRGQRHAQGGERNALFRARRTPLGAGRASSLVGPSQASLRRRRVTWDIR